MASIVIIIIIIIIIMMMLYIQEVLPFVDGSFPTTVAPPSPFPWTTLMHGRKCGAF